tara:strand:- start:380 stop:796 length:417 start_codon:yes stop_codon:yes gene_type:complete
MPKRYYTIKDWSGGMNNRKDPRDIADNECANIENMSIDSLGIIKTSGKLYNHVEGSDGTTNLSSYISTITGNLYPGHGLFYFESDHARDDVYDITDHAIGGGSNTNDLSTDGTIRFIRVVSNPAGPPEDGAPGGGAGG